MSERKHSSPPTPEQLFSRLTSVAYRHDFEFARSQTDAMDIERKARKIVGRVEVGDDDDTTLPIYNEKIIRFSAEREGPKKKFERVRPPIGFTIQQEIIKQVNQVPGAIRSRLDPEIVEVHEYSEPGDLNVVNFVHYSVLREDGDISINRNIGYKLRNIDEVMYESSELIGQPEPQLIPIAHRQKTIRHFAPIQEEAVEDKIEQVSYDAIFNQFSDGIESAEFWSHVSATRDADAAISILALVKHLSAHSTLPKKLIL